MGWGVVVWCVCVCVWWVGGRKRYVPLGWADGTTQNRAAHDNARKQPCERGRGVGPGKGKKVTVRTTPCALAQALRQGW